jgi:hypothetical protein
MHWLIDVRAWSRGGPVGTLKVYDQDVKPLTTTLDPLLDAIRGQDVILVAHGYNVNRKHGVASLTEWTSKLHVTEGTVFIGILWPGDCVLPIFVDYVWEGSEAEKSGTLVGSFIDDNFGIANSITLASHSLGARVVLQAIHTLQTIPKIRQLILMAPAIEDDTLAKEFSDVPAKVGYISVLFSQQDQVLAKAYPAGNLLTGLLGRGDPNLIPALGRSGPSDDSPANVKPFRVLPKSWNFGHTDYLTTDNVDGGLVQPIRIPQDDGTEWPAGTPDDLLNKNHWKPCWSAAFATTRWLDPDSPL